MQKQPSVVAKFESPFVHLKKSQPATGTSDPSTETNRLAAKTDGDDPHRKKKSRKRKKFHPVDGEISLRRHDMKAGTSDAKVWTRTVNLRAIKVNHVDTHIDCSIKVQASH